MIKLCISDKLYKIFHRSIAFSGKGEVKILAGSEIAGKQKGQHISLFIRKSVSSNITRRCSGLNTQYTFVSFHFVPFYHKGTLSI